MEKMLSFLAAFFEFFLLREKQKKPFVSPTFFCEAEKYTEMFSYQFEAHIPKIRQI